jgi:hypothetical protein
MRVDTTVVETNIHYPTDSALLGDGVRQLARRVFDIMSDTFDERQAKPAAEAIAS